MTKLIDIFGPFLIGDRPVGEPESLPVRGGTTVPYPSAAWAMAERLAERDAVLYGDEIIRLVRPHCRPFDLADVATALAAFTEERQTAASPSAPVAAEG